jgi:hypothetical protein
MQYKVRALLDAMCIIKCSFLGLLKFCLLATMNHGGNSDEGYIHVFAPVYSQDWTLDKVQ